MNQAYKAMKGVFRRPIEAEAPTEEETLQTITPLPSQQELEEVPTQEKLKMTITKTSMKKSSGPDGIPSRAYTFGEEHLTRMLHILLGKCCSPRVQRCSHTANLF